MSPLTIRLSRKPDGTTVLACTRADGSQTWQRHRRHAEFFPLHDLTHYAIETVLGLRFGFYGLLASGWNISDFGTRTVPEYAAAEAALAEVAVGLLDGERATGERSDADAFNEALAGVLAQTGRTLDRCVTDEELAAVRRLWAELAKRWAGVEPGEAMELSFDVVQHRD